MSSEAGRGGDTSTSVQGAGHRRQREKPAVRPRFAWTRYDMRAHETQLPVQIRRAELAFR